MEKNDWDSDSNKDQKASPGNGGEHNSDSVLQVCHDKSIEGHSIVWKIFKQIEWLNTSIVHGMLYNSGLGKELRTKANARHLINRLILQQLKEKPS